MADPLTCRPMRRPDLDLAVDWAAAEGWNPGLRDAEAFWAADPGGFWLAELGGEPIGSISVVRYGPAFGFLGFYIVRPEWRGRGHGLALWRAGMAHLGDRCVGLDGVVAQQENYRKSGFTLAHRNIRFGAERIAAMPPAPGVAVVPAATLPFASIAAFDATCFEAPRAAFLRAWLDMPGHVALAALRDGELAGYGVVRPCRSGAKVGPLFAEGAEVAAALFASLAAAAPAGPLFLDVPEPHAAAMALARAAGMAPVFETARMYMHPPPPVRAERIFGVTTFELG
ncbi:MAG: GNAT family N-acetyltransferase [Acetobacteraceae bacterium]|nr:GNAT family N-acetyltransferase [Acetobacteraceae bacterium]